MMVGMLMLVMVRMLMSVLLAMALVRVVVMVFVYHSCRLFLAAKVRRPGRNRVAKRGHFGFFSGNSYLATPNGLIPMRKETLWYIPCAFFCVAAVLNLIGCILGTRLAPLVKPALLPLLTGTTLAYLLGHGHQKDNMGIALLMAAQLFGCVGDILLIPEGFFFFVGGVAAFLIGHLFYMGLLGGQSWKGLTAWHWAIASIIMAAIVYGLVTVIGISGELFWPMTVYGFALMLLVFSAFAGVIRMPRGRLTTWWILLAGTVLFAFSDSCIAMGTFGVMTFPLRHFLVMVTYLAAQSLLAVGGIRLILGK